MLSRIYLEMVAHMSNPLDELPDDNWVFGHLKNMKITEISDEELKYTADRLGTIGGMQDDLGECFDELWRRYKALYAAIS
jgi:hypothetical protein